MPAADTWTINHESGGDDGSKLQGCIIERTAVQTKLFAPGGDPLGTVDSVEPPITFEPFSLGDPDTKYRLTIWTFDFMGRPEAIGAWETFLSPEAAPESGDWTAQAGLVEKGESAAAADAS